MTYQHAHACAPVSLGRLAERDGRLGVAGCGAAHATEEQSKRRPTRMYFRTHTLLLDFLIQKPLDGHIFTGSLTQPLVGLDMYTCCAHNGTG